MDASTIWTIASVVNYAAALLVIERILRTRRDSRGMLLWILVLLLLPLLGLILYLLVGQAPIERRVRRRRRRRRQIEPHLQQRTAVLAESFDGRVHSHPSEQQQTLIRIATKVSDSVVTRGNEVLLYHDAEQAFLELGLAIEAAQSHIHMEYYIFRGDETGRGVRDLLMHKAREGVEVRVLVDAVGSWNLRRSFIRSMEAAGVKVAFFMPWGVRRRFHLNCRNHRKLSVIDGRLGFFGSKNIADEYLGRKKRRYGPWRDTHLRVQGPCVAQLQEVFVEDWHFTTRENLTADCYFPPPETAGNKLVQMAPTGPDRRPGVLHQLLNAAVSDARHSVSLLTPYFVPDAAMMLALTSAAYRGVRVQVLLPSRTDHKLLLWAARGCYAELLDAGVDVYEYSHGMMHSKEVIVDGRWAMVGSANMDIRSFRINYELTSLLYDEDLAGQLQRAFERLRSQAHRIRRRDLEAWNYPQTMAVGVARLATPML